MGPGGLEPPTPRLSSACSNQLSYEPALTGGKSGKVDGFHDRSKFGADRIRTDDVLLAKQVLYQLSYGPGEESAACRKARSVARNGLSKNAIWPSPDWRSRNLICAIKGLSRCLRRR